MKNKFKKLSKIIFVLFILINFNKILADDILINAETVDIKESGNLILASGSVNITDGISLNIVGDKAKYNKDDQILEIIGNVYFKDVIKNYEAKSNKIILDRKKNIISTFEDTNVYLYNNIDNKLELQVTGKDSTYDNTKEVLEINKNVLLKDLVNKYEIKSEKIIYLKSKEIITSIDETLINYNNNEFIIKTKDISFDKNKNIFYTKALTEITDDFKNKFTISSIEFNSKEKFFKGQKIILSDIENNLLSLNNGFVNLKTNEIIGSDFNFRFNKNYFGNKENDPRLIGRYIITNKAETSMKKTSFTTCKDRGDKCPAWSVSAEEVSHIREKKRIEYKNAWLKIYDTPVGYFPYFYHPDPTVERQSGFLFPQFINSSNLGFSAQIPYFKVLDHDKDVTISPRIFADNNLFIQTEYRQAFENSFLISDLSFNEKKESNAHFFSTLIGEIGESFYEMKIQTVTNKDYLKKYQIQSPLIESNSILNSSIVVERNNDDYYFSTSVNVFEDLSKSNNDKYEYIIPNYEYSKETFINGSFFDTFNFKSSGNIRKYDTNIDEIDLANDFLLVSENKNLNNNFDTQFSLLARNINTYGDLSGSYKEGEDFKLLGLGLFNIRYPLIKENVSDTKYLTPSASIRYSPNKGINLQEESKVINFEDLFIIDRLDSKTVESGFSTTLGLEFKNENSLDQERFKLGMGVNFRSDEDDNLPKSTSLGQKTSDIIGYSGVNITENLTLGYNFSFENNLSDINYSLITANFSGEKIKTSFEYLEKSNFIGDESYLNNVTEFKINNSNSLSYQTNVNIDKNLTNYYNLIYEYQNDCLQASLIYNKQFYSEDTINSGKNIFLKISLLPFGEINTPGINE